MAALHSDGHQVVTLARGQQCPAGSSGHLSASVESEAAREWARTAEAIVHLAGLSDASLSAQRPLEYNRINALGTLNLLEAARQGEALFVLASSQRIYKPSHQPVKEDSPQSPRDPYAYSKLVAELWTHMYAQMLGLATATVRFFTVYGPGQRAGKGASGVVSIFMERALQGRELVAMGGSRRDLTFISDAVLGLQLAIEWLKNGHRGGVFNVATGVGTSLPNLALLTKAATGSASPVRVEPAIEESYIADLSRARDQLGYRPKVSLEEGLVRYAAWYRTCAAQGQTDA